MKVVTAFSRPDGTAARRSHVPRRRQVMRRRTGRDTTERLGRISARADEAGQAGVPVRPRGAAPDRERKDDEPDCPHAALGRQPEPRLDDERVGEQRQERPGVAQGIEPVRVAVVVGIVRPATRGVPRGYERCRRCQDEGRADRSSGPASRSGSGRRGSPGCADRRPGSARPGATPPRPRSGRHGRSRLGAAQAGSPTGARTGSRGGARPGRRTGSSPRRPACRRTRAARPARSGARRRTGGTPTSR